MDSNSTHQINLLAAQMEAFHSFLSAACRALDEPARGSDDARLGALHDTVTELRPIVSEEVIRDLGLLARLIHKLTPSVSMDLFSRRSVPSIRFAKYPTFLDFDLNSQRERVKTARLLRVFENYPRADLLRFDKLLDVEKDHLTFGTHGELETNAMLPVQSWVAVGLIAGWSTVWAKIYGFNMDAFWDWIVPTFRGPLWRVLLGILIYALGMIAIIGFSVGRYENRRQIRKVSRVSRWLKVFVRSTEEVGATG